MEGDGSSLNYEITAYSKAHSGWTYVKVKPMANK